MPLPRPRPLTDDLGQGQGQGLAVINFKANWEINKIQGVLKSPNTKSSRNTGGSSGSGNFHRHFPT